MINISSANISSSEPEITKADKQPSGRLSSGSIELGRQEKVDDGEVFRQGDGVVDFRTVGWIQASVIFLKGMFSLFNGLVIFRVLIQC